MNVQQLRDAITVAAEQGGAYGFDLHPTKEVMARVSGLDIPVQRVSVDFVNGSFVLIIDTDR
jgi:hypothetical protein